MQSDIVRHLEPRHLEAFRGAAKLYNVAIILRRTNTESLKHIGKPYAVPKRLDCKAKTADRDFIHPQGGLKRVAGLVVDPNLATRAAFEPSRYIQAIGEWQGFAASKLSPRIKTLEDMRRFTYIPNGGLYFVDLDPQSLSYACVKFASDSNIAGGKGGKCIHGDFDLYAIVPMGDPRRNEAVYEQRLGTAHARSREFFDVQHYVNGQLGVPMVLHGAEESWAAAHRDEPMDVFFPDGEIGFIANVDELQRLYQTTFRGRKLFTRHGEMGNYRTPQ